MIGKEEFKELIEEYYEQDNRVIDFCKLFPNSFDSPLLDWGFRTFDQLLSVYFTKEGTDWIEYYLYENPEKCYYLNDKAIPLETIDDLWKLIKEHRTDNV